MFAGAVFARRVVVVDGDVGLVVLAGAVRVLLLELVLDLVSPVVVLPPAGWAAAVQAQLIKIAQNKSSRICNFIN